MGKTPSREEIPGGDIRPELAIASFHSTECQRLKNPAARVSKFVHRKSLARARLSRAVLELQTEADQVDGDGLDRAARSIARMLCRIRVDEELMVGRFTCAKVAKELPAADRTATDALFAHAD